MTSWRDWNLPTKLAAATLVPVIFAVVLGVMQISDQIHRADGYRRVDRTVEVSTALRSLVDHLQEERNTAAVLLAGGTRNPASQLTGPRRAAAADRAALADAVTRAGFTGDLASAYAEVASTFDVLRGLRQRVDDGKLDAATAFAEYSDVVTTLLGFDNTISQAVADPALSATAAALHDLVVADEQIDLQQGLVAIGIAGRALTPVALDALRASSARFADQIADFRTVATADQRVAYERVAADANVQGRASLLKIALATRAGAAPDVAADTWRATSEATAQRMEELGARLGAQLKQNSAALQDDASDAAGLASIILIIALVVAAAVMFLIGRQLLGSLGVLRRSALDIAENRLPAAVARIRDGRDAVDPVVMPVRVGTTDEVGQVARAFDAVHLEAIRLATEQAGLRANYGNVFVNLSRRSQGLVQRQLQLLERLERDEEDAEQLATLFQLDHLATRMRRNNENLMVLSGSELARRSQQPTSLADLLRAAVSEIEQYQRAVILPPPTVLVVGYAVGDLVRMVAELLDNATAFSAPGTHVTVASEHVADGTLRIEVLDDGIGLNQQELAEANAKLAEAGEVDATVSRRMGLFVVGRLAARHGVTVRLHVATTGTRAVLTVPAELVTGNVVELATTVLPAVAPSAGDTPLPRRRPSEATVVLPAIPATPATPSTSDTVRPPVTPGADRVPLPRRERPAPRPTPAPRDSFTPAVSNPPPSEVDTSWWDSAAPARRETTPIFDEMVSAWFRERETPDPAEPADQTQRVDGWSFAADAGFRAADAVTQSQPATYTESGLPRRTPRKNLVPGSTPDAAGDPSPAPAERDADGARHRLASYQRGVSLARGGDGAAFDVGWKAAQEVARSTPEEFTTGGLPRRTPRERLLPGTPDGGTGAHAANGRSAANGHRNGHAANGDDNGHHNGHHSNGHANGEPVLQQGAHHLHIDAERLRGRLGSFQRGVAAGRDDLANRSGVNGSSGTDLDMKANERESE